jgi:hypothetical protein
VCTRLIDIFSILWIMYFSLLSQQSILCLLHAHIRIKRITFLISTQKHTYSEIKYINPILFSTEFSPIWIEKENVAKFVSVCVSFIYIRKPKAHSTLNLEIILFLLPTIIMIHTERKEEQKKVQLSHVKRSFLLYIFCISLFHAYTLLQLKWLITERNEQRAEKDAKKLS